MNLHYARQYKSRFIVSHIVLIHIVRIFYSIVYVSHSVVFLCTIGKQSHIVRFWLPHTTYTYVIYWLLEKGGNCGYLVVVPCVCLNYWIATFSPSLWVNIWVTITHTASSLPIHDLQIQNPHRFTVSYLPISWKLPTHRF